ncbi:MAG: M28 family peptidase [Acidobacteriota bacterium]
MSGRRMLARIVGSSLLVTTTLVGVWMAPPASAQEREDRTLLPLSVIQKIVDEVSGDRAMHHLLELAPYPRDRKTDEYEGTFSESAYLKRKLESFGIAADIEVFDNPGRTIWDGERGELWMVEPERRKLLDYHDLPTMLASNSGSGDWTGELVDVGWGGGEDDYAGLDLRGKIVLGQAPPSLLQRNAVFRGGAAGVISDFSLRPDLYPQQTLWQGIGAAGPEGQPAGFGFKVTPLIARQLRRRLARGEHIVLRAVVESRRFPSRMEVIHARIPGDGSSEQEIILSAHVFEGYAKQGANDDGSGSAAMLEIARALHRLIEDGKVAPPRRAINFLWVPEISGTRAWLQRHPEQAVHLIADINMDMVGESLQLNNSFFTLHRTPDSVPSFLNDVIASMIEFVGNTNRERVRYRSRGYRMSYPIVSPNGTRDPFYYVIDKHYGASDHVVYINSGIPAIIMVAWPDMFYHSSMDTPDKADPTQLKRAGVIATAGAVILAGADETMGLRIAGEVLGRGDARIGEALEKAQSYLADAGTESDFISAAGTPMETALARAYKEARVTLVHAVDVEMKALRSTGVFFGDSADRTIVDPRLDALAERLQGRQQAGFEQLRAFYGLLADAAGVAVIEPQPTELEQQAARRVPALASGSSGGFGFGRAISQMSPEQRRALRNIPARMSSELRAFIDGERSVLEIRDAISGEFEPVPLQDVVSYLDALEAVHMIQYR